MQLLNMSFTLHSFCSTNKFFTNANNFIMQSIHSNTAANAFSYLQREQVHPYPKQQEEDPKLRCHYFRLWFHGTMSQSRVYACSLKKKKNCMINYFILHIPLVYLIFFEEEPFNTYPILLLKSHLQDPKVLYKHSNVRPKWHKYCTTNNWFKTSIYRHPLQ